MEIQHTMHPFVLRGGQDDFSQPENCPPFTVFFEEGFLNIYPKPKDERCTICRRHVSKLEPFGHELLSVHEGRLQINYREADIWEYENTWECRECSDLEGALWEVAEALRLGRCLGEKERQAMREEKERELETFFESSLENGRWS